MNLIRFNSILNVFFLLGIVCIRNQVSAQTPGENSHFTENNSQSQGENDGSDRAAFLESRPGNVICDGLKECKVKIILKKKRNRTVGAVIKQIRNKQNQLESFILDYSSKLVWSPESKKRLTLEEAHKYCSSVNHNNPLPGYVWSLPSSNVFVEAFNLENTRVDDKILKSGSDLYNDDILAALELKRSLWTSSFDMNLREQPVDQLKHYFLVQEKFGMIRRTELYGNNHTAYFKPGPTYWEIKHAARCVAEKKSEDFSN